MDILLQYKADPETKDRFGQAPIDAATEKGNFNFIPFSKHLCCGYKTHSNFKNSNRENKSAFQMSRI